MIGVGGRHDCSVGSPQPDDELVPDDEAPYRKKRVTSGLGDT
jgi:hypothetical protein